MTALTPAARPIGRRLWNVMRLHAANPFTLFVTPLLVLASIFAINWMIWWMVRSGSPTDAQSIDDVSTGFQFSGASLWIFFYMMVVAIMAMNLSFSFALGFGSTRRDFLLGTGLTFLALSAGYALVYILLALLEQATGGWGLGGAMFNSFYFGLDLPWWQRLFNVFALFAFFFGLGSTFGAMYVRWRARGLTLFFIVSALVLVGALALITLSESWPAVAAFFVALGFTGTYALGLGIGVVAGVAAYGILRKATPRS